MNNLPHFINLRCCTARLASLLLTLLLFSAPAVSTTTYMETLIIPPADASPSFGSDLEIAGDLVFIGDGHHTGQGAVHIYRIDRFGGYRRLGKITQEHLRAGFWRDVWSGNRFGRVIDVKDNGESVLVGEGRSPIFLFRQTGDGEYEYVYEKPLSPDVSETDAAATALLGAGEVVFTYRHTSGTTRVALIQGAGTEFALRMPLTRVEGPVDVAASNDVVVVGAANNPGLGWEGTVQVFAVNGTADVEELSVRPPTTDHPGWDSLGYKVDIDGGLSQGFRLAAMAAHLDSDSESDALHLFHYLPGGDVEQTQVIDVDGYIADFAIGPNTLVYGWHLHGNNKVEVLKLDSSGEYLTTSVLEPRIGELSRDRYSQFGSRVAASGKRIAVAATPSCPNPGCRFPPSSSLAIASWPVHVYTELRAYQDLDGDGVLNIEDNCPGVANPDQRDENDNLVGDVCE